MAESETAASLFFRLPLSTVYKSLVINPQVYDYRYVADDLAFVRQCMKLVKIKFITNRGRWKRKETPNVALAARLH